MSKSKKEVKKKICLAASSGGHFEQLMMLKKIMNDFDCFIFTEKTKYLPKEDQKKYFTLQINRKEKCFLLKFIYISFHSLYIFLKEWPDIIICTGTLATVPICLLAKIFRKKLIYIESFAKTTSGTLTGQLLYKYADKFYVQWESMKEIYPNSIYLGGIY